MLIAFAMDLNRNALARGFFIIILRLRGGAARTQTQSSMSFVLRLAVLAVQKLEPFLIFIPLPPFIECILPLPLPLAAGSVSVSVSIETFSLRELIRVREARIQ